MPQLGVVVEPPLGPGGQPVLAEVQRLEAHQGLQQLGVQRGLELVEALVTDGVVDHHGAGQVEGLEVGELDAGVGPVLAAALLPLALVHDAVRGVGEVEVLDVVDEAPHLVVDGLQHPALVTPQPPQPRVFHEGVLVNSRQKYGADVELLQVLRPAEGTSVHSPEHALDVKPALVL